jgi:hypothetical protein
LTPPRTKLCGASQIAVQVGNVSASLGDRLWATWFSSAKEYARATTPIAIIRVNVQVQQGYPQPSLPLSSAVHIAPMAGCSLACHFTACTDAGGPVTPYENVAPADL